MNFFEWIRNGVRRAVLMGVSDAVNDLGKPEGGDDISHRLLEVIRSDQPALVQESGADSNRRRKLGRSLQDLQAQAAKAT